MRVSLYQLVLLAGWSLTLQGDYESERQSMIKTQIQDRGISHKETLKALGAVPRHEFVPSKIKKLAYADRPLPIGYGQTISQPYIVAYMTEYLRPESHFRVLEIGSGSGYQAAVLAEIVDKVFTIEIVPELAQQCEARMKALGYENIKVKQADGFYGWEEEAPFDIIIVTAAAEYIPPPLIEQLKDGGRMIIPVGPPFSVQQLILVRKEDGKIQTSNLIPVRFVSFTRG